MEELAVFADSMLAAARELDGMEQSVLRDMAKVLESEVKRNLSTSTDADGAPFLPLANGSGRKPLLDTLRMFNAVRGFYRAHDAGVECDVPYAAIQNRGGTVTKGERVRGPGEKPWVFVARDGRTVFTRRIGPHKLTIPPRPFMEVGERMMLAAVNVVQDHADRAMGRLK